MSILNDDGNFENTLLDESALIDYLYSEVTKKFMLN